MGTVLLSVLSGHWRYAHINAVRGDGINPGLLGMSGTVSEDAVRLAMYRIEETAGLDWLSTQILGSISPRSACRGSWTSTSPSSPSTATSREPRSATTRKNPAAPATSITATSWPTCASALASKCVPATNTPPPKACPDSGKPSKNFPATNGPPLSVATAATAARDHVGV